jgi:hypothetical protein
MSPRVSKPKCGAKIPRPRNVYILTAAVVSICAPACAQHSENSASVDEILRSIKRDSEVGRDDFSASMECGDQDHESGMHAHEPSDQTVGLQEFFEAYIGSLTSNDPYEAAHYYADISKSCYAPGPSKTWSRAQLVAAHRKFITTFPQRSFSNITVHGATPLGSGRVRVNYSMNYRYLGKKVAAGRTEVGIVVEKGSGFWQIIEFDETVTRF